MDQDWWSVVGLDADQVPELVVVEGSWWRVERERQRLALLDEVRRLAAPDWWYGLWRGHRVVYACVYGAARTVEPVHICGQLGAPTVVQLGSCGGLAGGLRPGDVLVPTRVRIGEGASAHYGGHGEVAATGQLAQRLATVAADRGHRVHRGRTVSTEVLLRQPASLVSSWQADGLLAVDMETSATFSAAAWCGMRHAALLHVWDDLPAGRSWTDPLPPDLDARRRHTEQDQFAVALSAVFDQP